MQPTTETTLSARVERSPVARMALAKATIQELGAKGYRSVFAAFGEPVPETELADFNAMWYGRRTPTDSDLPVIERFEAMATRMLQNNANR